MSDSDIYKGYVPIGADKSAQMPFKNVSESALLTLEEAKKRGRYAGVLREGIVLVDTDTKESADALWSIIEAEGLDCRVYKTDKGLHALFRDPEGLVEKAVTGWVVACGLVADFKLGNRNGLQVLNSGKGDREIVRDADVLGEIPPYLLPVGAQGDGCVSMLGMGEGDGRNDHYFRWILKLQGIGLSKDQIRRTLSIANKHVVSEGVSEDELDTIMRDESFKKGSFYVRKKFQHHIFGRFLIAEHHIKRLDGKLHVYVPEQGIYRAGDDELEHIMVQHIEDLPSAHRTEVLKYLHAQLRSVALSEIDTSVNYIAFRNGLFNLETETLEPFRPEVVLLNAIPWDYDPSAVCDDVDTMLDKISCGDEGVRHLIEEMIGYTMYRANTFQKAFVLLGDGSNGKSVLIKMMKRMLGPANVSHLDMQQLANRFDLEMLHGKLANLGDDISDEFMKGQQVSIFKKVTTGDTVKAEEKGKPAFSFAPYAKLVFSANTMPRIKDDSNGVRRRLTIVPFNAVFSRSDPDYDPGISRRLEREDAMKRLIVLAVDGLLEALENQQFTEPEAVVEETEKFATANDSVLGFLAETTLEDIEGELVSDVRRKYELWCTENGAYAKGAQKLGRGIKMRYGLESKGTRMRGKSVRVYG